MGGSLILSLAILVLLIVSFWKVFEKAGQPGWAAIVPIYNIVIMLKIAKKPVWWILLFLVPVVNIVMAIIMLHAISQKFGNGVGFTLGLIFLSFIFVPILAFGDYKYSG